MTPVCTETPKSAKKPTPEATLKNVCVTRRATSPPTRAIATVIKISVAHFAE